MDFVMKMKPARGPQTEFFSNYCHGILGLAQVGWQPAILKSRLLATHALMALPALHVHALFSDAESI